MTAGVYGFEGSTSLIENLCNNLNKKGIITDIGALTFKQMPDDKTSIINLGSLTTMLNVKRTFDQYDVIHNHHPLMNYAALFTQKPFVYHYHGAPYMYLKLNLHISMSFAGRAFKKVIAVSEKGASELKQIFSKDKIEVVYNGVDTSFFKPRAENQFRKGDPQLLFVGNMYTHKNVEELILAFKKFLRNFPHAHLQIVGMGVMFKKIKVLINRLDLENKIELAGRISRDELVRRYASCDVYLTASKWELFGLPLLEAMACARPIVASDIDAHTEILSRSGAGELYSLGNLEELCEKIKLVYYNKDIYAAKGLEFAKKHDWSSISEKILKIYKEIIN